MIALAADQNKKQKWTVLELINWTAEYLTEKKFENPRLEAERLLTHVLQLERIELYTNFDRPLINNELATFKILLKRRLAHEPLQYILGETEFFSIPFKVAPGVLIPRPETELITEKVIESCQKNFENLDEISILDVGTGSGCLAISIAKNIPAAVVTAIDISQDALKIALGNAQAHETNIRFILRDALKPWPAEYLQLFNIVVCNPPYVSFSDYQALPKEIKNYEPKIALLGGNDGLDFYRKFANILTTLLQPNGIVFFEIGERQASSVKNIFTDAGFSNIQIYNDLADKNRVIKMNL